MGGAHVTPGEITGIVAVAITVVVAVVAAFRARDVHAERQTELHAATVERARVEHNAEVARRFDEGGKRSDEILRNVGILISGQAERFASSDERHAELKGEIGAIRADLAKQVEPRHEDRATVQRLIIHVGILDGRIVQLETEMRAMRR